MLASDVIADTGKSGTKRAEKLDGEIDELSFQTSWMRRVVS